jgi:membrane protein insertase Oxa1/YidC/SpoIIIJ
MTAGDANDKKRMRRALARYNMVPNLIWSILGLTPISIYCFNRMDRKTFSIFLVLSLIPVFLKNSFIDKLSMGRTTRSYQRLGVQFINRLAQNGTAVNNRMRRRFPGYRAVERDRSSIKRLIIQTYVFEKFHLMLVVFFCLTTVDAMANGSWGWAVVLVLTNILYNIYPNLLQQYVRLKLMRLIGASPGS